MIDLSQPLIIEFINSLSERLIGCKVFFMLRGGGLVLCRHACVPQGGVVLQHSLNYTVVAICSFQ